MQRSQIETKTERIVIQMDEIVTKQTQITKKPRAPRSQQDQIQANEAETLANQLQAVKQHPEIAALLAQRSYDTPKIGEGQALAVAFQQAFNKRQGLIATTREQAATLATDFSTGKDVLSELRESGRIAFPGDRAAQEKLGIRQRPPQDQEKFLVFARACAAAATTEPYKSALTAVGFNPQKLVTALDALTDCRAGFINSEQEAKSATAERDAAFLALKKWSQPFYRAIRLALKSRPDLLTPLGL